MTAMLWSTPPGVTATDFPIKILIGFMHNHNLLRILGTVSWLTFRGGRYGIFTGPPLILIFCLFCSKKYVDSILSRLPAKQLHLSTPVQAVSSGETNATLVTVAGERETFDHIIFACHTDDALRILDAGSGATPEERDILGAFRWAKNDVWLHSDESVSVILLPFPLEEMVAHLWAFQLMPRMRLAWSSWNYIKWKAYDEKGIEKAYAPQLSS